MIRIKHRGTGFLVKTSAHGSGREGLKLQVANLAALHTVIDHIHSQSHERLTCPVCQVVEVPEVGQKVQDASTIATITKVSKKGKKITTDKHAHPIRVILASSADHKEGIGWIYAGSYDEDKKE